MVTMLPGPLRQPDRLAVLQQVDQLGDDDLQLVGVVAQRLDGGLQPRHVAVVVGAPDVDEQLEAPGELVPVVGDVGQQVRVLTVGLDDDPVLVVAVVGRPQPGGAVVARRRRPARRRSARVCSMAPRLGQRPLARTRRRRRCRGRARVSTWSWRARARPQLERVGVVGHLGRPLVDVLALVAVLGRAPRRPCGPPASRRRAGSGRPGR